MIKNRRKALANSILLAAAIIWGASFLILKDALESVEPFVAIAIRYSVAAPALALACFPRIRKATRQGALRGMAIGAMLFVPQAMQTYGLLDTTPGKSAFLTALYVVFTPFVFWLVDRKRPDRYNVSAALLLTVGVALISLSEALTVGWGDAITMLGGVLFAAHIVAIAKLGKGQDPFVLTTFQFVSCAGLSWLCAAATGSLGAGFLPPAGAWPAILYLAIPASAGGMLFQIIGQQHTDPSSASILMGLESVFGVIFSVALGYEAVSARMALGFAAIFCAVLISELKPWRKRPAAPEPMIR